MKKLINLIFILFFSYFVYGQNILSTGSVWKYYDGGDINTTTWKASAYNDTGWSNGPSELGYGDGDEATVVSFGGNAANKHITTYFRKSFTLSQATNLTCRVKVDDGVVVYLNGVEVFRNNLPSGSVGFSTLALNTNNENTWHDFSVAVSATLTGTNVLAVEMHQASASSSDLSFDFELTALPPPPPPLPTGVYINELMASNVNTLLDNTGDNSDWVEIFNNTGSLLDLSNYYLTDDYGNLTKFRFTSQAGQVVVPAGGYLVVWCSGVVGRGSAHTSFSLSSEGEQLALVAPDGMSVVDSLSFGKQRFDVSYGRLGTSMKYFGTPSPNAVNGSANTYEGLLSAPVFSQGGGFFSMPFSLSLSHADTSAVIVYSDDSSEPSASKLTPMSYQYRNNYPNGSSQSESYRSYLYNSPISISEPTTTANRVSKIATTHSQSLDYLPSSPIYKGRVIRARVEKAGYLPSEIVTNTYFFNGSGVNPYGMAVVSVTTQADNFFDYNNGIYVPGVDFDNWRNANPSAVVNEGNPSNYRRTGEVAERAGHLEIMEGNTTSYKQDVGLRMHGGWSRGYRFKTIRLYGTDQYKTIEYPLFANLPYANYKTFLLRNSGNDYNGMLFKDAFVQRSVRHMKPDIQEYRPSILFLNGEYWGIHNLRQRQDKHYYEQKYGVDADNLDILSTEVEEGDANHYNAMRDYIAANGVQSSANYDYIKTQMDTDNFSDYQITQIYFDNNDWGNNNNQYWRLRVPYNANAPLGHDGRWRWSLFDLDATLSYNSWTQNRLEIASSFVNYWDPGFLLGKLLENQTFKVAFINRFADMLNTAFLPTRLTTLMNEMKDVIAPQMTDHLQRWKTLPSYNSWLSQFINPTDFIQNRPIYQRQHIRNKFGIGGEYNLTVNVSDPAHGSVKVNSIVITSTTPGVSTTPYPWAGSYFDNLPLQLRAVASAGYQFKHWLHNNAIVTDSVITLNTASDVSYTAVFEEILLSPNPTPGAFVLAGCPYKLSAWSATNAAGTYPDSMRFVYMDAPEPTLSANIAGFTTGAYNHTSRTRINGKESLGFSFINTSGNVNPGYPNTTMGGALLALNTTGKTKVVLRWRGRTHVANPRQYAIRLRYRVGDLQGFTDMLDSTANPVEYVRNATAGHSQEFEVELPLELLNKPYVQLLWQYYYTGVGVTGARDELGVDDIEVSSQSNLSGLVSGVSVYQDSKIVSVQRLSAPANVTYWGGQSVELRPGFEAQSGSIFLAQINGCN